jgi:FMN-binding domain
MKNMQIANRRQALQKMGAVGLGATSLMGGLAFATVFMEIEQAQKVLQPNADAFQAWPLTWDEAKLNAIAKASDTRVPRGFQPKCWRAVQNDKTLGWVIADRVVGKYDLIDYAAGFDAEGTALGIEILAYRESHGAEVRQTAWRKQFVGKKGPGAMRFADDIRNISGATLSCQHVTEGMQRVSALALMLASGK